MTDKKRFSGIGPVDIGRKEVRINGGVESAGIPHLEGGRIITQHRRLLAMTDLGWLDLLQAIRESPDPSPSQMKAWSR